MTTKTKTQPQLPEGFTRTQVEAMLKSNTWWPFTRVDASILEKVHRAQKKPPIPTEEEALL